MIYLRRLSCSFIPLCFLFFSNYIQAASGQSDSLKTVLKSTYNDSIKVKILHQLYVVTDSLTYPEQELKIAKKINSPADISQALLDIGRYYYFDGKPDLSLTNLIEAIKIAEKTGAKKILISAYRYTGYIYRPDDPFIAEDYYNKGLKLAKETGDALSASYLLSALGNVYEKIFENNSENNRKALAYYLQSLEIRERIGSNEEIAASLNETSRLYDVLELHDKALELRLKGLDIAKKSGSLENIVYLCNSLGNDYIRLHNFKKALEYHLAAYSQAKALKNNLEVQYDIAKGIAYDYHSLGDAKKSNDFYQQSITINDSIKAETTKHDYNLSGLKHNLEQELEKQKMLLKDAELLKANAQADRLATLRNASFIGFGLILVLVVIVFRGNRQKQKSNKELEFRNKEIETAYKVLAESETKFKLITETINDVFYLFNIVEKKYEYISPNCNTMFGFEQQWIYEHNTMKGVVYKPDLPLVIDANVKIDSGIPYDIEYRVVVNNEMKWIAEQSSPIYDEKGKLVRNSGIFRDISSLKKTDEHIRHLNTDLQKNVSQLEVSRNELESFSYSIAHDLKAPLRAILGYSAILQEDYLAKLDDEGKALLTSIGENGVKMSTMIDDLLRFSGLGKMEIEKSDINMESLVGKCLDEINSSTKNNATIKIHSLPPARGDYALLTHVWNNLLLNAIKFSSKKETPQIDIGSEEQGGQTVYFVKDNGAGFDMAYADKLFGVFQRLHNKQEFEGIGIGLAIAQKIISRHGGRIWAEGAPGQGATFYFSLGKDRVKS